MPIQRASGARVGRAKRSDENPLRLDLRRSNLQWRSARALAPPFRQVGLKSAHINAAPIKADLLAAPAPCPVSVADGVRAIAKLQGV